MAKSRGAVVDDGAGGQSGCAALQGAFSHADCARLLDLRARMDEAEGGLVLGRAADSVRRSRLCWLPETDETEWVHRRMAELAAAFNRDFFGFALDGFEESLQLARYGVGDFYDWHVDRGQGPRARRRKLGISVQLSAPTAYSGGEIEINDGGCVVAGPREQGAAVAFAGFVLHRVVPVTSGERHSLVAWLHGPAFT